MSKWPSTFTGETPSTPGVPAPMRAPAPMWVGFRSSSPSMLLM